MAFLDFLPLIGSVVSGIGSLIGQDIGNKNALEAVDRMNSGNMALAEYQYQTNLDMWNRQNEYNSPVQQMQRLKDAGLNPNLMYGQGNVGNASSLPEYKAPQMGAYTGFGDLGASAAGNQLIQGLNSYAQIKKVQAETDAIRQNTENLKVQGEGFELRNLYQSLLNSRTKDENGFIIPMLRSKLANLDSSTLLNQGTLDLRQSEKYYTDAQRKRFEQLTPLVYQQVETSLKQALFDYYKLSPAKLNNILSSTVLTSMQSELTKLNSKALFNEIEFGEKSVSWNMYKREYDSIMFEYEKSMKAELLKNGINLKGSNWFTPLIYSIEKYVAEPIGNLLGKFF